MRWDTKIGILVAMLS